ncbi:MAG: sensor histidine kinase [Sandaracinaceae bacterium]
MSMKHRRCPHLAAHGHGRWRHTKKLQRRLFMWSGMVILFTAVVVMVAFRLMSPSERMQRDMAGFERFVSARFEDVWDEPGELHALVHDLHHDLGLDVTLRDRGGHLIERAGAACTSDQWAQLHLRRRSGEPLGEVTVCGEGYQWGGWRSVVVLLLVIGFLWATSGMLARLLLRPLRKLEHMARRIGEGDLSARSTLDPRRHGELGVLGLTMDEMAARIEKQLNDQRELLAAVSHELRTPLGHMRLLLEMAREKANPKYLEEIEGEVLEIDGLVGQLLASSRVDFGSLATKAVDVTELVKRTLGRLDLSEDLLRIEGEPAFIEADPTLLGRALANLLNNAAQHGKGVAAVTIRFLPDEVVFAVDDRGPGFGKDERQKVFEAFYRGEHRAGGSLGLGLSLVARIARAHGGHAWIEDADGGGARVCFSLNAVELEAAAEE